jgi:hypothetical protein
MKTLTAHTPEHVFDLRASSVSEKAIDAIELTAQELEMVNGGEFGGFGGGMGGFGGFGGGWGGWGGWGGFGCLGFIPVILPFCGCGWGGFGGWGW